jgi:hypothetical protein
MPWPPVLNAAREPHALSRLRASLFWTPVFGALGMMGELLVIDHCARPGAHRRWTDRKRITSFAHASSFTST